MPLPVVGRASAAARAAARDASASTTAYDAPASRPTWLRMRIGCILTLPAGFGQTLATVTPWVWSVALRGCGGPPRGGRYETAQRVGLPSAPITGASRKFGAFGRGTAIRFPVTSLYGERYMRLGTDTIIGPHVTLSAGIAPSHELACETVGRSATAASSGGGAASSRTSRSRSATTCSRATHLHHRREPRLRRPRPPDRSAVRKPKPVRSAPACGSGTARIVLPGAGSASTWWLVRDPWSPGTCPTLWPSALRRGGSPLRARPRLVLRRRLTGTLRRLPDDDLGAVGPGGEGGGAGVGEPGGVALDERRRRLPASRRRGRRTRARAARRERATDSPGASRPTHSVGVALVDGDRARRGRCPDATVTRPPSASGR